MQVLEFADAAVAGFQHFQVKLGGDVSQVLGLNALEVVVHHLAPGPEAVSAVAGALAEARHRALMGVRMNVGNGGESAARRDRRRCRG